PDFSRMKRISVTMACSSSTTSTRAMGPTLTNLRAFELTRVVAQPLPVRLVVGAVFGDVGPEAGRVVHLAQVGELVDHEVVEHLRRRHDDAPVEVEIADLGAAAPEAVLVLDGDALD